MIASDKTDNTKLTLKLAQKDAHQIMLQQNLYLLLNPKLVFDVGCIKIVGILSHITISIYPLQFEIPSFSS